MAGTIPGVAFRNRAAQRSVTVGEYPLVASPAQRGRRINEAPTCAQITGGTGLHCLSQAATTAVVMATLFAPASAWAVDGFMFDTSASSQAAVAAATPEWSLYCQMGFGCLCIFGPIGLAFLADTRRAHKDTILAYGFFAPSAGLFIKAFYEFCQ